MIPVTPSLALDERDLEERFIRASGPGGQNVNKVSTAVELRFNMNGFTEMPDDVRARLERLAGRRLTLDGEIVIRADEHRTQDRNRSEAQARAHHRRIDPVQRSFRVSLNRRAGGGDVIDDHVNAAWLQSRERRRVHTRAIAERVRGQRHVVIVLRREHDIQRFGIRERIVRRARHHCVRVLRGDRQDREFIFPRHAIRTDRWIHVAGVTDGNREQAREVATAWEDLPNLVAFFDAGERKRLSRIAGAIARHVFSWATRVSDSSNDVRGIRRHRDLRRWWSFLLRGWVAGGERQGGCSDNE
ncbi:MAG: aminoacyl-tRNA hydrolase [Caulobacteraceae bacterium]|nr:aminoacyl-tRNA hydrolase [Caulobacteraceae bacterium]